MLNIVFPMAGHGERFARQGFRDPKPMIKVLDKPIIQHVLETFPEEARYIFIVRREHLDLGLGTLLKKLKPNSVVVPIDHFTEGPVCTALLAREEINNDHEVMIADCDSLLVWPDRWVLDWFKQSGATGGVTIRVTNNPACSYAALDARGWVLETREKDPFTQFSTTGPYWWRHGRDFVSESEQMIRENRRINGEFYVCPVYNYHIARDGRVLSYFLPEFWSLGTPEDVNLFVKHRTGK